ncbi:MAG TPA: hypothetical protein VH186_15305 [Chloroflexia bacterium]|nr:hypothetical protein [Chloroflexia bacterium]
MPKNMHKRNLMEGIHFTTIPDYFLAHIMTELSHSELRVMLYIYLHTLGYGKLEDAISYDQFLNGVVTNSGHRLDKGAGISRRALVDALASLEKKGLITRKHSGGFVVTALNLAIIEESNVTEVESVSLPATKESATASEQPAQPAAPAKVLEASAANKSAPLFTTAQYKSTLPEQGQNLHPQEAGEVQNLPKTGEKQGQNLHPTCINHEHENHDHGGELKKKEFAVELLVDRVAGLTSRVAKNLVKVARSHGRDDAYLERLATYVASNPAIHTPAAVLTTLVKSNQDRSVTNTSFSRSYLGRGSESPEATAPGKSEFNGTGSKKYHKPAKANSSIDWSKFAPGGKYAYLAGSSQASMPVE